jgi:hypothetical protein
MPLTTGAPLLCDLSEARVDDPQNIDFVMPDVYRTPNVVLGMPWSSSIDIWGFAMTVRIIPLVQDCARTSQVAGCVG